MPLDPKSQEFVPTSDEDDSESSDLEEKQEKKKQAAKKKKEEKKSNEKRKSKDKDEGSSVNDGEPSKKKSKSADEPLTDKEGNKFWPLTKTRRVGISNFRGKSYVNIREYYEKDGQMLPGKKGISLPIDQWKSLCALVDNINNELD